jgi:hypothetical protein
MSWTFIRVGLLCFGCAIACKKAPPPPPTAAKPAASAASSVAAGTSSVASVTSVAAVPPKGQVPGALPAPERKAVPLDGAAQKTAKQYLASLSQGRKATVAKDFAAAEAAFTKCLELVPNDARALSERGYARLLTEKLDEAEADLKAAEERAPNVALKLQVLHNRMLVARKLGKEREAALHAAQKQRLKSARKIGAGVSCNAAEAESDLVPERPANLEEAFRLAAAAHAKLDETDPSQVRWGSDEQRPRLTALAARGPLPEDSWSLETEVHRTANHLLISRGGKLYLFPTLSAGNVAMCGYEGLAELKFGGGVKEPLHILRTSSQAVRSYSCSRPDGSECDGSEGETFMGYCTWSLSRQTLILLDAKTLDGIREFTVTAEPSEGNQSEPTPLLDFEWQTERVTITACGEEHQLAYRR